jgi:hypothetical protein
MGQSQSQQEPQSPPRIYVLTKQEAVDVLARANRLDGFRDTLFLDEVNLRARSECDYTPMDGPDLSLDIPDLKKDVVICWMSPSAEAGMPHTRAPNIICEHDLSSGSNGVSRRAGHLFTRMKFLNDGSVNVG